jgi:hypothetical protein
MFERPYLKQVKERIEEPGRFIQVVMWGLVRLVKLR